MQWFFEDDHTAPVFTARQHIESKRAAGAIQALPRRAAAFCLGQGLPVLQERCEVVELTQRLPGFITYSPVYAVKGCGDLCFLDGGRGAPQGACTVEALHALGVEELLVVGLCGAFAEDVNVCDVLLPARLLVEEGVSRHYFSEPAYALPRQPWAPEDFAAFLAQRGFLAKGLDTVTTDAPYRQTYFKEARWRELGCAGVDMEASAMVSLCNYYDMKCAVALMASDKHPLTPYSPPWAWGSESFKERQKDFINACIDWMLGPGASL